MKTHHRIGVLALVGCLAATAPGVRTQAPATDKRLAYPAAERGDAADTFHGERVPDPYRWLEDLESPGTRSWIKAQDDLTRTTLGGLAFDRYRSRIEALATLRRLRTPVARGSRLFYFETDANGISGRVLKLRDGAIDRTLVDLRTTAGPSALSTIGGPSPSGRLLAYGVAVEGTRWVRLHLRDVDADRDLEDRLDRLHTSMGSIAWTPDEREIYYVRLAPPAGPLLTAPVERAEVMRHRLGSPVSSDERVFALDDSPRRRYTVAVTDDGRWVVVTTSIGADLRQQVWVKPRTGGAFAQLFPTAEGQFALLGSRGDEFWLQTSAGAPRHRVVRVHALRSDPAQWIDVIPEPGVLESLSYVNLVAGRLIVVSTRDAAPRVAIHALDGTFEREVPLPPLGTVWGASGGGTGFTGRLADSHAYFTVTSVADPGSVHRIDPHTGRMDLVMRPAFGFDPGEFVGEQVFYPSKDGTRVPMFIARHRRTRPGAADAAAILYGYGAAGWSAYPWFQPQILAWMESGGVYAVAGLRGGGEYGEAWHEAARRERKQTSVDDYVAAAGWLVANGHAGARRVVANGGSLSGVVAAAAIVQQPSLFGAALIDIPALDLVRYDRYTGAAAWIPELGSTASPAEFRALRALSPYHNLQAGTCYPSTLVTAGERDDVAVPSHAYKFVAALQHAQRCQNPALLQVAWNAGHTFGASNAESAETWARQLAFVDHVLGRQADQSPAPPRPVLPEVEVRGSGDRTMVLIPCMSCRWRSWEPFMDRNADRWRMFAVTLPGFGGTPVPALPMNGDEAVWHDHAVEAVIRLLEERDLRDVVLVGHSFGSTIALQVAARVPGRVSRLVNVDGTLPSPRSWFKDTPADRLAAARALDISNAKAWATADAWQGFNAVTLMPEDRRVLYHGMFMATPREVVFQYWRENLLRDMNPLIAGLTQPVLDIKVTSPIDPTPDATWQRHIEQLREAGAPPTVQSVRLSGTGHFVMELEPAWLESAIATFVAGEPVGNATASTPLRLAPRARFGHVESIGQGPVPMILMPCLGCDWRAFDQFMARHAHRYRMYAVTWPGMADTPMPRIAAAGDTPLLDNVSAALEALITDRQIDRPVIVAHSAAGPVAVRFAVDHPGLVRGIVTIDATIQNRDTLGFDAGARRAWADAEMAQVLRRHDDDAAWIALNTPAPDALADPARVEMYRRMWLTPPRAHVLRYWREWLRLDAGRLLKDVKVPLEAMFAIGAGEQDPAAFEAGIRDDFRRNGASPSVNVSFIRPATHSIWETNAAAFDAAVDRFVARVTGR